MPINFERIMIINPIKMIVFISFILSPVCIAGSDLMTLCHNNNGSLYINRYIDNININDRLSFAGSQSAIIGLFYNNQWYSATGPAAASIWNSAIMAILMHRKVDLCVDNKVGQETVYGIQFN